MKKYLYLLVFTLCFNNFSYASYISLNTTLTSSIKDKTLVISGSTINKGDESAHNVKAEIKVKDKDIMSNKISELKVNGTYTFEEKFNLNLDKPGTYPVILTIHYTDANQYPFAALSCQTFSYKKDVVAPIFGQLGSITISKEGKIKFALKNFSDKNIKTKTVLVTPRELSVQNSLVQMDLAPKYEGSVDFFVKNFSALNKSTYQVYAVSETEDESAHYTSISQGIIKVIEIKTIFGLNYTIIISLLVILIAVFFAAQFLKKKQN